ncbi:MAG: O-antigen ligase family protein, partial [Rubrobacteridae bacterium]|nr:O-antigen ligase family protein [Rubrobacteridae bacterium]
MTGRDRLHIDWQYLLMLYLAVLLLVPVEFYNIGSGLPFDIQFDRIIFFGIFVLWIGSMLVSKDPKLVVTTAGIAILLFAGVVFLSFVINMQELTDSMRFSNAVKRLLYVSVMVILFFFVMSAVTKRPHIDKVFLFVLFIAFIVSTFTIVEFVTEFNASPTKLGIVYFRSGHVRTFGSADHPIALGVMLSLFLPLALHYFQFAKRPNERIKYGLYMTTILLAMITTISRTPLIAVAAMLIVYAFYRPRQAVVFAMALAVVIFSVHMVFPGVIGGLTTYFSPAYLNKHEVNNPFGRLADQPKMIAMFFEQPLYGRGYGCWDNKSMFFVDNQYLKVMVELGIIGVLGLMVMFFGWIREVWSAAAKADAEDKDLLVAVLAACVAYIVTLATYDSFGYAQVTYLFFVLAGLGASLARIVKPSPPGKLSFD